MRQQRNEYPQLVENIGLNMWHVRWDVQQKNSEGENPHTYYDYEEVEFDHEPSAEEIAEITKA